MNQQEHDEMEPLPFVMQVAYWAPLAATLWGLIAP